MLVAELLTSVLTPRQVLHSKKLQNRSVSGVYISSGESSAVLHTKFLAGHFKGSIFVTRQAHLYLKSESYRPPLVPLGIEVPAEFLEGSRFSSDVDNMKNIFDKTTKLRFRNSNEPQYIKFGSFRDKDVDLNIRSGQLKLPGYFFQFVICRYQSRSLLIQRRCSRLFQTFYRLHD